MGMKGGSMWMKELQDFMLNLLHDLRLIYCLIYQIIYRYYRMICRLLYQNDFTLDS